MMKRYRLIILLFILVMLFISFMMIYFGVQQGNKQQQIERKVDYSYKNFAKTNSNVKDGVLVLAYHRILKKNAAVEFAQDVSKNPQLQQYNVDQTIFMHQMKWLKSHHISVWSMDEFIKHSHENTISGKHVVLTFDDIDTTLPRNAAPTLYDLRLPFTIFVITGRVGSNLDGEQLATWQEISKLSNHPEVTVGLHTNDLHYQEDNKPILSTTSISKKSIISDYKKSYNKIKNQLGITPTVFAYPYGSQNVTLTQYMYRHGMQGIFLLEPGIVSNDLPNILQGVPRFVVTNTNFDELQSWLKK